MFMPPELSGSGGRLIPFVAAGLLTIIGCLGYGYFIESIGIQENRRLGQTLSNCSSPLKNGLQFVFPAFLGLQ